MIKRIIDLIERHTTWKKVGISFIFFILMMTVSYSFFIEPQFKALSDGLEAPDTSKSSSVEELKVLMTSYSQEAINFYLTYFVIYDIIFPLSYAIFFSLFFAALLKKIVPPKSKFLYLTLIPILHMLVDYLENILYIYMVADLPNFSLQIAKIPLTISSVKWAFWPIETLIAIILILAVLINWVLKKKSSK